MNYTNRNYRYLSNKYYNRKKNTNKESEEASNILNQNILDSIIDDDEEKFTEFITQSGDTCDINKTFTMTNYKLPRFLSNNPSYASLCAFFRAEKCLNTLSLLVPAGLASEQIQRKDDFGRSPIHFAAAGGSLNIIRELHQAHFSLDEKDNEECLPSHYAAMAGNLDVFQYLWMKGADLISSSNQYNRTTPLHIASLYGNLNIVRFICETVVGDKQGNNELINFTGFHNRFCNYSTPLHLACEGGHEDVLRYLLSRKDIVEIEINSLDHSSRTPLLVACKNGSLGCVKALIEYDKSVLKQKKNRKHHPLIDASASGYVDIVSFLLSQKEVKIEQENSKKMDALMSAVRNGHLDVVKCLIERGALKKYDENKLGDLFLCGCGLNNIKMIKYLDSVFEVPYFKRSNNKVSKWTSVSNLKLDENTSWGTQYMQQGCMLENEDIVSFLLSKKVTFEGIDLSINASKKWTPFMDFLLSKGFDLSNNVNSEGVPSIVSTIRSGNLNNVKKMISKGATLDAELISKFNCVSFACRGGKKELFDFLMSYEPEIKNGEECVEICLYQYGSKNIESRKYIAEEILKKGFADVNKSYNKYDNETLVSRAINIRSYEFLEIFERYGADFTNVPLRFDHIALKRDKNIVDYLCDHGCTFNKIIEYKDKHYSYIQKDKMNTPLMQSFYLKNLYDFNPEFPLMLIDYISQEEIDDIKNGGEQVIDELIDINSYSGVLKIYDKCGCVVYPRNKTKKEFQEWINNSNNETLIELVNKNSKKKKK